MITRYGRLGLVHYWHQVARYFKQRTNDYDVAWLHYPLFFGENPFKKCLVTIHSTAYGFKDPSYFYIYQKIASAIERHCLNRLSDEAGFTGVSRKTCEEFQFITKGHKRITFIPNGVDTEAFKPTQEKEQLRAKFSIPNDATVLLSVGRLVYHKMPFKLIDIFEKIQRASREYVLLVAGKGKLFEPVKEYTKEKNVNNVRFLGFMPEETLPDLYACADFFIIISTYEGGEPTLTVAEAMASGLPCIVSDIPNLQLVVEDAQCGIAIDFSDTEKAAERITSYLKEESSEHSRNAREYSVNNLDWKIIAQRYLEEFEKLG